MVQSGISLSVSKSVARRKCCSSTSNVAVLFAEETPVCPFTLPVNELSMSVPSSEFELIAITISLTLGHGQCQKALMTKVQKRVTPWKVGKSQSRHSVILTNQCCVLPKTGQSLYKSNLSTHRQHQPLTAEHPPSTKQIRL